MTLDEIEKELEIEFPKSYTEFVKSDLYDGYLNDLPFYSHIEKFTGTSVLDATSLFHLLRDDCYEFAVIRRIDDRFLLIKCKGGNDSKLYEVDRSNKPKEIAKSLHEYIKKSLQNKKIKDLIFDKVLRFLEMIPPEKKITLPSPYGNIDKIKIPKLKSNDWKVIRSCIHDKIVGIAAYNYSEKYNTLEIPIFAVSDHPIYEAYNGVKSILISLFSASYKLGVPLNISFREDFKILENGNRLIPTGKPYLPSEIKGYLEYSGIKLKKHINFLNDKLSLKLYALVLGLDKSLIDNIISDKSIPLSSICYIVSNTIWSLEEIEWFLKFSSNKKHQLIGEFDFTNRFLYSQNVNYSRYPISISKFKSRLTFEISNEKTENLSTQKFSFKSNFKDVIVTSNEPFLIPWLYDNEKRTVDNEELKVEFNVSNIYFDDYAVLINKIEFIESLDSNEITVLMFTKDYIDFFNGKDESITKIVDKIKNNDLIFIGFMPFDFKGIDDVLMKKWQKCKTVRI